MVRLRQRSLLLSIGHRLGDRANLEVGGGFVLGGTLGDSRIDVGGAVTATGSYLVLAEGARRPFLLGSLSLSGSHTTTDGTDGLTALDARLGVVAGKTFFDRLTLYAVARVFGGPVFWRDQTGSDRYHVALGGGLTLRAPGVEVFVDGSALGERSLSGGVGLSF